MKSVVAFRVIFLFPLGRFLAMMNKDETKKNIYKPDNQFKIATCTVS